MSSNLRFIVISTILCGGALCRRDDALQAYTYPLEQPPSGERQDSGAPSPLAQLDDKSSQVTDNDSSLAIFEKRILPIFQSDMPSSCAECHLSGVDLKEYIRPTQQQTFASLVSNGLIDLKQPDDSKIHLFKLRTCYSLVRIDVP